MNKISSKKLIRTNGMTLVELVVSVALFAVIAVSAFQAFSNIINIITVSRNRVIAMALANEQFEIIRNLPYSDVGIVNGVPSGKIPHIQTIERSSVTFTVTATIRNTDDPFDGLIGESPNDLSPADYKLVELEVTCASCPHFNPVFINTKVAPKNLETASTNGALFVRVFDANGQAVPDASVHIENNQVAPAIVIDDTTNVSGILQVVDVPPGNSAYEIYITKSGYTSDQTYTPGAVGNPNPLKPHATVALQQVTQTSFAIDEESSMDISTITQTCQPVPSVDFSLKGARLIGTGPDVVKFDQNYFTNGSGLKTISGLEWDTYSLSLTDFSYDLAGTNPIFPVSLSPGSYQEVSLVVVPTNPRNLLVVVKDLATGLPLANATVRLEKAGYDETFMTGLGFISQTNWEGGDGQATSTDETRYFSALDIDDANPAGEVKLSDFLGTYQPSGFLVSSTFDTGAPNNFHQLLWGPADQPALSGVDSVRFQIATNNDTETWNFLGPDGTDQTFYTTSDTNISAVHNNSQFLRYKLYLSTDDTSISPNISNVSFTYTSSCIPPGQVLFNALDAGTYDLTISHNDYVTYSAQVSISNNWQSQEVLLSPL